MADRRINAGPGRLLLGVYAVFALAAGARAVYQLATKFSDAPTAYVLSAFAAAVYLVATLALARRAWLPAIVAVGVELVGVLTVGTWSLLDPDRFPDATVWSDYGRGYGYVPVLLPLLGLIWLVRTRPSRG
jgi:hypothetical protein